jgi:hypothetical protein
VDRFELKLPQKALSMCLNLNLLTYPRRCGGTAVKCSPCNRMDLCSNLKIIICRVIIGE